MSNEPIVVNNFKLPHSFATFLRTDKADLEYWRKVDKRLWHSMFSKEEVEHPHLFSYHALVRVNQDEWTNRDWAKMTKGLFLGKADGTSSPGFLAPQTSVLIGEINSDGPIALDFSVSPSKPTVCYLNWQSPNPPHWSFVVPDVDTLLTNLGISP
jgi:hypothetical protein